MKKLLLLFVIIALLCLGGCIERATPVATEPATKPTQEQTDPSSTPTEPSSAPTESTPSTSDPVVTTPETKPTNPTTPTTEPVVTTPETKPTTPTNSNNGNGEAAVEEEGDIFIPLS